MNTAPLHPAYAHRPPALELWTETVMEWRKAWRQPAFALPALIFPIGFYVLFAVLLARPSATFNPASYMLASYGAFGVIGPGLFAFGMGLALERDQGYLKWRMILPSRLRNYFLAKMGVALGFALIIVAGLLIAARFAAGYSPSVPQTLLLIVVLALGSLPFSAIGLACGAWLRGSVAPGVLNGVYLPAAALSGLWFPLMLLPKLLQQFAWILPPFHLGQLAQSALGRDDGWAIVHIGALVLTTLIALWVAHKGLQRKPF